MSELIKKYENIISSIKSKLENKNYTTFPKVIAVSKTFKLEKILPLIDYGHLDFGENKVQEAINKWTEIKKKSLGVKLHMIGKLQTNKVKNVIPLFDYIHSLDNQKLADILSKTQKNTNKFLKYFIQVNLANETQKSGISVNDLDGFYNYCTREKYLEVVGLMIIPPNNDDSKKYFQLLDNLNKNLALKELSMGMSSDYLEAVKFNSTFVRVGSQIFGQRT